MPYVVSAEEECPIGEQVRVRVEFVVLDSKDRLELMRVLSGWPGALYDTVRTSPGDFFGAEP